MKRQLVLVIVVLGIFLALAGILAGALSGADRVAAPEASGMPVPGLEDVEESIVTEE